MWTKYSLKPHTTLTFPLSLHLLSSYDLLCVPPFLLPSLPLSLPASLRRSSSLSFSSSQ